MGTSTSSASTLRYGGGSGSLNAATELQFYTAANNTTLSGTQRLTINSTGYVGIGTTSPAYTLDVAGNGGNVTAIFGADNSATTRTDATQKTTRLGVPHYTNAEEPMALLYGTSAAATNSITIGGGTSLMNAATQISLYTAANNTTTTGTERMRIDSSGYVGIGTTNPQAIFHSVKSASAANATAMLLQNNGSTAANTAVSIDFTNTNATTSLAVLGRIANIRTNRAVSGDSDLVFSVLSNSATTERMRIMDNGNVGIGTATPNAMLQVDGAITGKAGVSNASTTIDFSTGNLQYTTASCQAFALHNVKDGGSYTFAVQGVTSATCSFTAYSDAGTTALTVHLPPDHGATTASKHTLYSLMNIGGHVYIAWTPGY